MGLLNKFKRDHSKSIKEEILESLTNLLCVKQHFGAWQQHLGLSDYSHANQCDEMIQAIIDDICQNITLYEKRFKLLNVTFVTSSNPLNLCFELNGSIEGIPQVFYVYINKGNNIMISTSNFSK